MIPVNENTPSSHWLAWVAKKYKITSVPIHREHLTITWSLMGERVSNVIKDQQFTKQTLCLSRSLSLYWNVVQFHHNLVHSTAKTVWILSFSRLISLFFENSCFYFIEYFILFLWNFCCIYKLLNIVSGCIVFVGLLKGK